MRLISSRNVLPTIPLRATTAMPAVLGLTYLFNLFVLCFGFGNGAGCCVGLASSYVMVGVGGSFGHGISCVKTGLLCVTSLSTLSVTQTLLSLISI